MDKFTYINKETEDVIEFTLAEMHVVMFVDGSFGMMAGSFTNALIDALFKADFSNFAKLKSLYPEYADAVKSWSEGDLFARANVASGREWELAREIKVNSP